jgi:hypothetical protein
MQTALSPFLMYWSDKRFYKIQVGADVTATLIEEAAMESQGC